MPSLYVTGHTKAVAILIEPFFISVIKQIVNFTIVILWGYQ